MTTRELELREQLGRRNPTPTFQQTQRPFDTVSGNIFMDEDELTMAVMADSPMLRYDEQTARSVVRNLNMAALWNPEIHSWKRVNLGRAINMTTPEYAKFRAFELAAERDGLPWQEQIWQAAQTEYLSRVGSIWSADQLLGERDVIRGSFRDGQVEGREVNGEQIFDALTAAGMPEGERLRRVSQVETWIGREGEWAWDGAGNLALRVNDQLVLLRLDEGTAIRNTLDAVAAYSQAAAGRKHAIAATGGDASLGKGPNAIAAIGSTFGAGMRLADRTPIVSHLFGAINRITETIYHTLIPQPDDPSPAAQQAREEHQARQFAANDPTVRAMNPTGQLVNAAGMVLAAGFGGDDFVAAKQALEPMLSSKEGVEMLTNARRLATDDAIARFKEALDAEEKGPVSRFVEDIVVEPMMTLIDVWDNTVHYMGVHSIDFFSDLGQGVVGQASAGFDIEEGFDRFKSAFEATDASRISEELGVEGTWAMWVDLGASVALDPITWVTGGGRGAWKALQEGLTDPTLSRQLLSHPKYYSASKHIARGGRKAQTTAYWLSQGMDTTHMRMLDEIARNGGSAEDVLAVMDKALHESTWVPAMPGRYSTRQIGVGFANALQSWNLLPQKMQRFLEHYFARAGSARSVSLGRDSLNEVFDNMAALKTLMNDDEWFEWRGAFFNADDEIRGLRSIEATAAEARVEALEKQLRSVHAMQGHDVATVMRDFRNLSRIDEMIAKMGKDAPRDIIDNRDFLARRIEELAPVGSEAQQKLREITTELNKATAQAARLADVTAKEPLVKTLHEFYQFIGRKLGLDELDEAHPYLTGEKALDWRKVTGEKAQDWTKLTDTALDSVAFAADDPGVAKVLGNIGMFARRGYVPVPAAPMEILLYQYADANTITRLQRSRAAENFAQVMDAIQGVFFFSVLANPITAGKVTLDETLRFLIDTGNWSKFTQATIHGLPGVGAVTARAGAKLEQVEKIPGMQALGRWMNPLGDSASPYTIAHGRDASNPAMVRSRQWSTIKQGDKLHPRAMERWTNGHLLEDEPFKAWARESLGVEEGAFTKWWNENQHRVRKTMVQMKEQGADGPFNVMRELDEGLARESIEKAFKMFSDKAVNPDEFYDKVLVAASRGEKIPWEGNQAFFRRGPSVPGQDLSQGGLSRGASGIMEAMFSTPQSRRASIFYSHYHDWIREVYQRRFEGRILDESVLVQNLGVSEDAARAMIHAGTHNRQIRELLEEGNGLVLQASLDDAAANWAKANADRLMYQIGAVSVGGRMASRVYPFVRAHVEFLDWWTRRLFAPLEFQLNPTVRSVAEGIGKAKRAVLPSERRAFRPGRPFLNRPVNPTALVGKGDKYAIPFNARLWSQWSHMASAVEGSDNKSWLEPGAIVDGFTFLPSKYDSDFLQFIIPGLGPIPAWMIGTFMDPDHPVREMLTELHPQLQYLRGRSEWEDIAESLVPRTGRSVRSMGGSVAKLFFGSDVDKWGPLSWLLTADQRPFAIRTFEGVHVGNHLRDLDIGDRTDDVTIGELQMRAWDEARRREGATGVQRLNPAYNVLYDDYGYLEHFDGFMSEVDRFVSEGRIADSTRDELKDAWKAYTDGSNDVQELRAVRDTLVDSLFNDLRDPLWTIATVTDASGATKPVLSRASALDKLLIDHPQTAVNVVSRTRCATDKHGQLLATGDDAAACATGRLETTDPETRKRFFDNGWLEDREMTEWLPEAEQRIYDAARRYAIDLFNLLPTTTYLDVDKDGNILTLWEMTRRKSFLEASITVEADNPLLDEARKIGIRMPPRSRQGDLYVMTGAEYVEMFRFARRRLGRTTVLTDTRSAQKLLDATKFRSGRADNEYLQSISTGLVKLIEDWGHFYEEEHGIERESDWPEEAKAEIRRRAALAIEAFDDFTIIDYNRDFRGDFGDIDFDQDKILPKTPADLDKPLTGRPDEVVLVDGDTLQIPTKDGNLRMRIIGLNAPEKGEWGFGAGVNALNNLLEYADRNNLSVTFGLYQPELYGVVGRFFGDQGATERVNVFMFVGDRPVYDKGVFTSTNPRGVGVGGQVPLNDDGTFNENWLIELVAVES